MKKAKGKSKVVSISSRKGSRYAIRERKRVNMPVAKSKTALQRLNSAYHALGVTYEQVASTPAVTHILNRSLHISGTFSQSKVLNRTFEFLRGSTDPDARKIILRYDEIPESLRLLLPFEAFALAAGLTTERALEVVFSACLKQSDLASNFLAAAAQPEVIAASVRRAKGKFGAVDAKMLLSHSNFLPLPKTTIISAKRDVNLDQSQHATIAIAELGSIDRKMSSIADRFNEQLGLSTNEAGEVIPAEAMPVVETMEEGNGESTPDQ